MKVFATVGTHEQPFDRLLRELDRIVERGALRPEDVFAQTGYARYLPARFASAPLLPAAEVARRVAEAAVVVTHGGLASIMQALSCGKVPVVVPRRRRFGEHVDDHQLRFARRLERSGLIIAVTEIERLEGAILAYEARRAALRPERGRQGGPRELARRLDEYCRRVIERRQG